MDSTDSTEGVWFRNPKTGYVHLVVHTDTIVRCRREGHIQVHDPRLPVDESAGLPDSAPEPDPDAAREAFGIAPAVSPEAGKPVKRVTPRAPRPASNSKGA